MRRLPLVNIKAVNIKALEIHDLEFHDPCRDGHRAGTDLSSWIEKFGHPTNYDYTCGARSCQKESGKFRLRKPSAVQVHSEEEGGATDYSPASS